MTTKTDAETTKVKETFKKAQPLPLWTGALAPGSYAAPAWQPAVVRPPLTTWPETAAVAAPATAAGPGTALWSELHTAQRSVKEGFALGVLALAALVSIVQAFGTVGELAPDQGQAGAPAARLVG